MAPVEFVVVLAVNFKNIQHTIHVVYSFIPLLWVCVSILWYHYNVILSQDLRIKRFITNVIIFWFKKGNVGWLILLVTYVIFFFENNIQYRSKKRSFFPQVFDLWWEWIVLQNDWSTNMHKSLQLVGVQCWGFWLSQISNTTSVAFKSA